MVRNIEVCNRLANNIEMIRNDDEFFLLEKSSVADALYGLLMAKNELEDERLETAIEIVLSYLFYIELFKEL